MKKNVKYYIENCIEIIKTDIKFHKKFGKYSGKFWLNDAQTQMDNIDMAMDYDMLPGEVKKMLQFSHQIVQEKKKKIKVIIE